jgi:hypothetical protein
LDTSQYPAPHQLRNGQRTPDKFHLFFRGDIAMDALGFEFMGLVMLALCVVVLAVPSGPRPFSRRARH